MVDERLLCDVFGQPQVLADGSYVWQIPIHVWNRLMHTESSTIIIYIHNVIHCYYHVE